MAHYDCTTRFAVTTTLQLCLLLTLVILEIGVANAKQGSLFPTAAFLSKTRPVSVDKTKSWQAVRGRSSYKTVSSKRSTGCYTKSGTTVRNPRAYAAAKKTAYTKYGKKIHNPAKYAAAVQQKSIANAASAAVKRNPKAKAFTYTVSLPGQKKYVGMTTNPSQRMSAHVNGTGAKCIKEGLTAVTFTPHASVAAAKKKETATYFQQKKKMGGDRVRGAGHTKKFPI
eukprot:scaffold5733_cov54-Attheya_sp.AAC.3